ncbi:hypothetical protein NA57DRAFT_52754 [Rhizodiscina lignyota]|uniref:Zn(2)-C6 fungal-type domain-containing protein n=1 Tax=Rhizodiscina lignyota TaxID=1504668 RepID=A0A9P4M9V4_9PEZI|nr:hypothetical protein NA57DRAFT_52754 [Rhizodiscina lignyota]
MSGEYRLILPAAAGRNQPKRPENPSKGKRIGTTAACGSCRKSKIRCSGERPTCEACRDKTQACEYDTLPGESRSGSLRAKNERLETDLTTLLEIYWFLQTKPTSEAEGALASIRLGAEPSRVLEALRSNRNSSSAQDSSNSVLNGVDSSPHDGEISMQDISNSTPHPGSSFQSDHSSRSESASQTPGSKITVIHEGGTAALSPEEPTFQAMLRSPNTIMALERGVEAFHTCTGCIFHIFDQNEAKELLSTVIPVIREAGENWPLLMLGDSTLTPLKASLSNSSSGLEPSEKNGTYPYVTIFYELSRHLMEAAIENNALEAMKICAGLSMYNIIGHSTIALAYTDMGLNIAVNMGLNFRQSPVGVTQERWLNQKRVARTLVTLRGWLVSTLGYVPRDNIGFRSAVHWMADQEDLSGKEIIQRELAKVVEIEANLLHTVKSFTNISPPIFSSIRGDLARWYQQLPDWMHLSALIGPDAEPNPLKRTVFLVHLFYLSANILVARLAQGNKESPAARYDIGEVRIAIGDGLLAARTAARILQLQLDEQTVFQRFTSYMSCLTLLHSTAQMILHNYPESAWRKELPYAKSTLDVLEHCGAVDPVGKQFAEMTRAYHDNLKAQGQADNQDMNLSDVAMPDQLDHLFTTPSGAPAELLQISQELLKLIGRPFGHSSNLHTEGSLKAGFGSQLDWNTFVTLPFNKTPSDSMNSMSLLSKAFSSMRWGQFVGSSRPHGWAMVPS